jgi:hypothetical protein
MRKLWLVAAVLAAATPVLAQPRERADRARMRAGGAAVDVRVPRGAAPGPARPVGNPAAGGFCAAPYKFAAGACVTSCPGGYEDRGSICAHRGGGDAR